MVEPLAALVDSDAGACLQELGFAGASPSLAAAALAALEEVPTRLALAIDGAAPAAPSPPVIEEEEGAAASASSSIVEDDDADDVQLRLGAVDADEEGKLSSADEPQPPAADEGEQVDDEEPMKFGSEEDIDRLKRMFGESL